MRNEKVVGLHLDDVGHNSPARWMSSCGTTERMQVGPENEVIPLAKSDAEAAQCSLNPGTLSDPAGVGSQVAQLIEERMGGFALPAIGLRHQGGKVVAPRLMQCILADLFQRAALSSKASSARGSGDMWVRAAVGQGDISQQQPIWEDGMQNSSGARGVTGRSPASFEQLGSSEVRTRADCMTWHQAL